MAVLLLLSLWNAGRESYRTGSAALRQQLAQDPWALARKPWELLRIYVSRDSDEKLYYWYTELVRGRAGVEARIADRRATTIEGLRVRPGEGARLPHRDFSVEYPPLMWLAILPPALLADSLPAYRLSFGLWMSLVALAGVGWSWRLRRRLAPGERFAETARTALPLLLGLGPILAVRFDILPAVLTLLAAERAVAQKPVQAGLALGAGAACKIYPIILAPVLVAAWLGAGGGERWRRVRGLLVGLGASLAVLLGPFLWLAGSGLRADLSLHSLRPLQIESVLATPFFYQAASYSFHAFGGANLAAPGADVVAGLSPVLSAGALALTLVMIYLRARTGFNQAVIHGCVLALLACLCTAKVLSSQYLTWLIPFLCVRLDHEPRWLRPGIVLAMILGQIWYPLLWPAVVQLRPAAIALVVARNGLMTTLFVGMVVVLLPRRAEAAPALSVACDRAGEGAGPPPWMPA